MWLWKLKDAKLELQPCITTMFFAARILTQHNHQLVIYLVGDDALEKAGVFKTLSFVQQRRL
jgi:hypothetical protein